MADILHRVGIKAPADKVFAALTEQKGLAGWWTTEVKAAPEIGTISEFRFGDKGFNDMKVMELVKGKSVRWRCINGAQEWIGTELTFHLREDEGSTVLLFAQCGWREQAEFMHYCSTKWGVYLLSLKWLCETGKGAPYPDDVDIG